MRITVRPSNTRRNLGWLSAFGVSTAMALAVKWDAPGVFLSSMGLLVFLILLAFCLSRRFGGTPV